MTSLKKIAVGGSSELLIGRAIIIPVLLANLKLAIDLSLDLSRSVWTLPFRGHVPQSIITFHASS